jgi:hypothetical protein
MTLFVSSITSILYKYRNPGFPTLPHRPSLVRADKPMVSIPSNIEEEEAFDQVALLMSHSGIRAISLTIHY